MVLHQKEIVEPLRTDLSVTNPAPHAFLPMFNTLPLAAAGNAGRRVPPNIKLAHRAAKKPGLNGVVGLAARRLSF